MAEKIIVIAVRKPEQLQERFQSSLDELISLSNTAGGEVEGIFTQNRNHIHPATYLGEGKLREIKAEVEAKEIDLVISNDELSSGQLRNLNNYLGVRIIDRSQLILDIFAQRAQTKEGKLQVELAQLEYLLPRLRGQGIELSRLGGGIGTRGPGETQLETDRRHIRRRIGDIKNRLKLVVKQREQYRKRRRDNAIFQIAIVGYTNAGKSTLFNKLTDSHTLQEDKLFATLDPLTRKIVLPSGFQALITDTVGFLQDLPTSLIAAFRSTLEEVAEADFLLHVIDASHVDYEQHIETVGELLRELDADQLPMLYIYNKKDLLEDDFIAHERPYAIVSAYEEEDMQSTLRKMEEMLEKVWLPFHIALEPNEGRLMVQLEQEAILTDKSFDETDNRYHIKGYIRENHALINRLKE
ncbi:GTPase HflX [Oceanobacillus alkalisoli]|uniref:GTPase HflX n=1 Tax=Oceanobacillus alkalisoli TaxID=2925113 RepID=UPI001EF14D1A|nr:GTPase HflX [Oceanobacillus alkalisoli]MCF3942355.1 GTPase HflX [Oceanobacillus alkalisoli]MCG5103411.1 GTPase HflX [Oceanobacillus alkalisoli]